MTLGIGQISSVDREPDIKHRSEDSSVLRWAEIMTLKNCLDEVVYHVR